MAYRTSNRNELIYRMHEEQKKSFAEIAELFGISRGRAWQIYVKKKEVYARDNMTQRERNAAFESEGYLQWRELERTLEKLLVDQAFAHRISNCVARAFGYVGLEELKKPDNHLKLYNTRGLGKGGIAVLEHLLKEG